MTILLGIIIAAMVCAVVRIEKQHKEEKDHLLEIIENLRGKYECKSN